MMLKVNAVEAVDESSRIITSRGPKEDDTFADGKFDVLGLLAQTRGRGTADNRPAPCSVPTVLYRYIMYYSYLPYRV